MRKHIMLILIAIQLISMLGVWQVNAAHSTKEYEEGLIVHKLASFDPSHNSSHLMIDNSSDIYIARIDAYLFQSSKHSTEGMQAIDYYRVTITNQLMGNTVSTTHILAVHTPIGLLETGSHYIISKQWNVDVFTLHSLEVLGNNFAYQPSQLMKLDGFDPDQPLQSQTEEILSILSPYI